MEEVAYGATSQKKTRTCVNGRVVGRAVVDTGQGCTT